MAIGDQMEPELNTSLLHDLITTLLQLHIQTSSGDTTATEQTVYSRQSRYERLSERISTADAETHQIHTRQHRHPIISMPVSDSPDPELINQVILQRGPDTIEVL